MTEDLEARLRERCETERFYALAQDLLQAADTIAAYRYRIKELEDRDEAISESIRAIKPV